MSRRSTILATALTLLASFRLAAPVALADPPSHAPAHGWRKKLDPYYVGYTGYRWSDDYGIRSGRCERDRVGTVLGAAVGGAIGSTFADGDDRLIAMSSPPWLACTCSTCAAGAGISWHRSEFRERNRLLR